MWFKRQTKNRRLERKNVLDVKLHSQQVRSHRLRFVGTALTVLVAILVIGVTVWRGGEWLLNRLVLTNPSFALRTVDVQTEGMLSSEQVLKWSGIRLGDNLWALDLAGIKRELELVPFIDSVSVLRVPPRTLRLKVVERLPIAKAVVHLVSEQSQEAVEETYYLDAKGYAMPSVDRWPGMVADPRWFEALPVLVGVSVGDLRSGLKTSQPKILAALRLLEQFESSAMVGLADIAYIDLGGPGVMSVRTSTSAEVTFSVDRLEEQLWRWRLIHDQVTKLGRVVASLDLSVSNFVPVRWLEAAAVPAAAPKTPKAVRPKKPHV